MTKNHTQELISQYYHAFNQQNLTQFLSLLDDQVIHDINQGSQEVGKEAFGKFIQKMNLCYKERISSLAIMTNDDGSRAAAEFMVEGEYLMTDNQLPTACGQTYRLPGGAFFSIRNGKISRITNYYNLQEWLNQIKGK